MDNPRGYDPDHYPGFYRVRCDNGEDYWPCWATEFCGDEKGIAFFKDGPGYTSIFIAPYRVVKVTPIRFNGMRWERAYERRSNEIQDET